MAPRDPTHLRSAPMVGPRRTRNPRQRPRVWMVLIPLVSVLVAPSAGADTYEDGTAAFQQGDYATALRLLKAAVAANATADRYCWLGFTYLEYRQLGPDRLANAFTCFGAGLDLELTDEYRAALWYGTGAVRYEQALLVEGDARAELFADAQDRLAKAASLAADRLPDRPELDRETAEGALVRYVLFSLFTMALIADRQEQTTDAAEAYGMVLEGVQEVEGTGASARPQLLLDAGLAALRLEELDTTAELPERLKAIDDAMAYLRRAAAGRPNSVTALDAEAALQEAAERRAELTKPPPPQTGSIALTVVGGPPRVRVELNGEGSEHTTQAPIRFRDVKPGRYTVRVAWEGWKPNSATAEVRAGQEVPVRISMEREPPPPRTTGDLDLTVAPTGEWPVDPPEEWQVRIDGADWLTIRSPHRFPDLAPGPHRVEASHDAYYPSAEPVDIIAGKAVPLAIYLKLRTGTIVVTLSGTDSADLYLDGERIGLISRRQELPVPPGRHTVRVSREGYDDAEETVTVAAEQKWPVHLALAPSTFHDPLDGRNRSLPGSEALRYTGDVAHLRGSRVLATGQVFADRRFSVEVQLSQGAVPDGCGLAFRTRDDTACLLVINGQGQWRLLMGRNETLSEWAPWRDCPDLRRGRTEWNTLAVECRGSRVKVVINGRDQGTLEGTLPSRGGVGICSTSNSADVAFRNLRAEPLADAADTSSAPPSPQSDEAVRVPATGAGPTTPAPTGDQASAPPGRTKSLTLPGGTNLVLVWVPGGEFQMGSDGVEAMSDEKPAHRVRLDGFWIGRTEVTIGQWAAVMGSAPAGVARDPNCPVTRVTWDQCAEFCRKVGARLPTEAQWEYAARGARGTVYPWGNDWDASACQSVADRHRYADVAPVGSLPNGASWCGALDMAGNVYEWCADAYDASFYSSAEARQPNPECRSNAVGRVLRGGSWDRPLGTLRSANREWYRPIMQGDFIGFRVCQPA